MLNISNYIIPLLVLIIIIYGLYKKVDIYSSFIEGIKDGISLTKNIIPPLVTMIFAINIFLDSNVLNILKIYKLNIDILPMMIIRPISGNASFLVMTNLIEKFGVDSYIARLAEIMQGSTDTTIYVLAIYFGSVGIRKSKYALKAGLMADMVAFVMSFLILNLFLK